MVDSFAGRTYKNVQRFSHRATKSIMRSHHFRIPVYDMPIRLRPVRHLLFRTFPLILTRFRVVVYCVHVRRHAGLGFPRVHKLLPLTTAERQTTTFHLSRDCNRRILFYLRCGRVRISLTLFTYRLSSLSSDARRIWFWRYSPVIFTGTICFFAGGIISEVVQSMLPVRPPSLVFGLSCSSRCHSPRNSKSGTW